jgi:hypothetical protein
MAKIAFEGEPATLVNWAASAPGSIHDDERARELGFRRGFVPGTTIALLIEDAIVEVFGKTWFEGGWHDMKFIAAVYDDEPVRVVLSEDGGPGYALAVLTPDDRLTTVGRVGLGTEPPWDASADGARAGRAFPASVIGKRLKPVDFTPGRGAVDRSISPGISAKWFTGDSPFGGPLTPSCGMMPAANSGHSQLPIDGALPPGMIAHWQMVFERPVLRDRPYHAEIEVADKGESRRTWFRTIGYQLFHEGERYGFGRLSTKWWAPLPNA